MMYDVLSIKVQKKLIVKPPANLLHNVKDNYVCSAQLPTIIDRRTRTRYYKYKQRALHAT